MEARGCFQRERQIVETYFDVSKSLGQYQSKFLKPFEDLSASWHTEFDRLRKENHLRFLDRFREFFNPNDVEEYIQKGSNDHISNNFLGGPCRIQYFGTDSNKWMEKGSLCRENVLRNRIEYFRSFGIDLGDDYEAYASSAECLSLLPPQEVIDEMVKRLVDYQRSEDEQVYKNSKKYSDIRAEQKRRNYLIGHAVLNIHTVAHTMGCIIPNARLIDGEVVCSPIMYSSENLFNDEYTDNSVNHELNHLREFGIIEVNEKGIKFVCGWDTMFAEFGQEKDDLIHDKSEDNRDYELLNEIINEIIAQEITVLMHKRGVYIANSPGFAKVGGSSAYENYRFLVDDFYKRYREVIIESRRPGNIEVLFSNVGKDNFEDLNRLTRDFKEMFPGNSIFDAMKDAENGLDNEGTRKLHELEMRRDDILNRMAEYSYGVAKKVA